METGWQPRSPERPSDAEWSSMLNRVRAEFSEMPCLRVTCEQARALFGLPGTMSESILDRLARDGFLESRNGEYLRRHTQP